MTEAETRSRSQAVTALTAYRVVSRAYFHLPILFVFFFKGGLSIVTIELLIAVYGVVVALAPAVTASWTRNRPLPVVLGLGEAIKILGLAALALGPNVGSALVGQVLSGTGFAFTAGTDSALLSTLCSGAAFRRREAVTQGWMFAASFVAGAIGAALFSGSSLLPFAASAMAAGCAIAALVPLRRATSVGAPTAASSGAPTAASANPAQDCDTAARVSRETRSWQLYYAMNRAFLLAPYVGFIPLLLFEELRLGVAWFGLVLGVYTLSGFAAARSCPALLTRFAPGRLALLPAVLTTAGLALLAISTSVTLALVAIVALGLGGGLIRPTAMSNMEPFMRPLSPPARRQLTTRMERIQAVLSALILVGGGLLLLSLSVNQLFAALAMANLALQIIVLAATWRRSAGTTIST